VCLNQSHRPLFPRALHIRTCHLQYTRLSGSKARWRPSGGIEVKGKGHMDTWVWAPAAETAGSSGTTMTALGQT
jgi:hypothetical protein